MAEETPNPPVALGKAREHTVSALCTYYASDHLTVEEFESRLDASYAATTLQALSGLTADLPVVSGLREPVAEGDIPQLPMAAATEVAERGFQLALMGGSARRGAWTPPRHLYSTCLLGGAELDFREARFAAGTTEVTVVALMGGVDIVIPPNLTVRANGLALMGGFDGVDQQPENPGPDAPLLKINGFACMGGVSIDVRLPGETARDAKRRRRFERKSRKRRITSGDRPA